MAEREPYSTSRGVENAIKDAAKRAAAADPSLDANKRIQLEYFHRFLSRVFSEAEDSDGYAKLSRPVPHCTDYRSVDLAADLAKRLIDPALAGDATGKTWSHETLSWS